MKLLCVQYLLGVIARYSMLTRSSPWKMGREAAQNIKRHMRKWYTFWHLFGFYLQEKTYLGRSHQRDTGYFDDARYS